MEARDKHQDTRGSIGKGAWNRSLDISKMYDAINKRAPALMNFMEFTYKKMKVDFEDETGKITVNNQCGVSQGCPLSPAIF